MLTDELFQRLLFDLFCLWHDVQRHFDPPRIDDENEKMFKVKKLICKLLNEIDARAKRIRALPPTNEQEFIEEWTMLAWNVMCITSRLQNNMQTDFSSSEDKVIYTKLNLTLIELVNYSRSTNVPPALQLPSSTLTKLSTNLTESMEYLHTLYHHLKTMPQMTVEQTQEFDVELRYFATHYLIPFIDFFKSFCNEQTNQLWADVRAAQIKRVIDYRPIPHEPVNRLVSFYSYMMHKLAVLGARLQGFRFELTKNRVFGETDPLKDLSDSVFTALELLMSDCVLSTDPSTNTILVTNNLFSINCGALARGVVFKQFDVQIITEEMAEVIQSEMRRQKMLQQPAPIGNVPSAALLAMKPTSGMKRSNSTTAGPASDGQSTSAHKKSDVNSKEIVTIYPVFNAKNRYWAATYPQLLCTTRQKGRQSTNNSFQDLSPSAINDSKTSGGKRPIFYFHICATMFSPSGKFADAHTLSLPITIATRRNQDCQVQRMMSSYTATCFWLYGTNVQDGLLLQWCEAGMSWENFKALFKQHFRVNAEVQRGLEDRDFELLQYKLQCNDCSSPIADSRVNNCARVVTFKNMLCPHLRYECGSTNVRFSVWRGMLELLQIFQDQKTNVRKLWEKGLVLGFLEFDQVASILTKFDSTLVMRLSFITGGTICFTVKTNAHSLMHLEPLDLKKLQAKCLKDYLRDIAVAEKVKYIINSDGDQVLISDIIDQLNDQSGVIEELETSRSISSNVTHLGDIDSMQNITFTAMRIAVVTCKVKPPSTDIVDELQNGLASSGLKVASSAFPVYPNGQLLPLPQSINNQQSCYNASYNQPAIESFGLRLPANATSDDFARELIQLCNFHGKSRHDLIALINQLPEHLFCVPSTYSSNINNHTMNYPNSSQQYSPPVNSQHMGQMPILQPTLNGGLNSTKYSHIGTPSPMNTSPAGSTSGIGQPMMGPLSINSIDNGTGMQIDQSTPPPTTPNTFIMSYNQL